MALNYGILAIYKQTYGQNLAITTKSVIYGSVEFYETGPRGTVLQIIIGYLLCSGQLLGICSRSKTYHDCRYTHTSYVGLYTAISSNYQISI